MHTLCLAQEPWVRTPDGRFHGTKALAKSAIYPTRFATALCSCWAKAVLPCFVQDSVDQRRSVQGFWMFRLVLAWMLVVMHGVRCHFRSVRCSSVLSCHVSRRLLCIVSYCTLFHLLWSPNSGSRIPIDPVKVKYKQPDTVTIRNPRFVQHALEFSTSVPGWCRRAASSR